MLPKSAILTSQDHPLRQRPSDSQDSTYGANPSRIRSRPPVLRKTRLLSSNEYRDVMLLTKMSGSPSPFKSPQSTPMPLNESWPSTLDGGVVNASTPSSRVKWRCPGVERLY